VSWIGVVSLDMYGRVIPHSIFFNAGASVVTIKLGIEVKDYLT
jgi:hypothetical protein